MLIAYATAEGELASDVGLGAGPYASVLAEEIVKPGIEAVAMFRVVQRRVRTAIKQEPYLGFNAMGDVYLAGAEAPKPPSAMPEAAREWERVDKTSSVELETFVRRHGSSPEADYARARIEDLKKQVVSSVPKTKQPAPMEAMLRCESFSERAVCEFDPSCSWAEDKKQCQRKSGSLAAAMLESAPASKPKSDEPCVDAVVGKEKRCLKPGDNFKDCPDCPEMVVVPAGSFMMGAPANEEGRDDREGPQRNVTIARPFAVGKFEVTFAEWDACVAAGGCKHNTIDYGFGRGSDYGFGRGKRPVISVSWNDITKEYLPWLSRKTGKAYRLLTEAEWEYAARAGTTRAFPTGAGPLGEDQKRPDLPVLTEPN
jgi:formylglycine-generating enzyme required for sulfatase activity